MAETFGTKQYIVKESTVNKVIRCIDYLDTDVSIVKEKLVTVLQELQENVYETSEVCSSDE